MTSIRQIDHIGLSCAVPSYLEASGIAVRCGRVRRATIDVAPIGAAAPMEVSDPRDFCSAPANELHVAQVRHTSLSLV